MPDQLRYEDNTSQQMGAAIKGNISSSHGPLPREDIDSYVSYLNNLKINLNKKLSSRLISRNLYLGLCIFMGIISIFLFFSEYYSSIPRSMFLLGIPYSLLTFFMFSPSFPISTLESEIRDIDEQMELIRCSEEGHEIRAERRFRHHEYELKRYYDLTLNQSSKIFFVGVFSILSGMVFILIFSYWATLEDNDKIILGSLGAIGSILSNYIAVIYGRMYKDTINSLNQFHNRLVTTHHLHYGAVLSSQIKDNKLIDQTLSQMAINTSTLEGVNGSQNKSSEDDTDRPELV